MRKITFIIIVCFVAFLFNSSNEKGITQTSNCTSNLVNSLVQTTDYLKLQVNSPMKLGEYTTNKNNMGSLVKSKSKDIIFIPNKGQIIDSEGKLRPDILYKAELGGVDLYLTKKGMGFVFYKYEDAPQNFAAGRKEMDRIHDPFREKIKDRVVKMYRMDLDIVGMNTNARTLNVEQTTEYFNYYYAHCPDGITNVHGYRKVIFENVYNNIDLVYYSNEKGLKYDFIVKPGGDVADIKLKYENEDEVYITKEGKIRAINSFGELETDVLYTYQSDGKIIESNYVKEPDGTIRINTGEYDKTKELIIDPYIGATYYGGSGDDKGYIITTNENDNIFVTGSTGSSNFPLQNPGGGVYFQGTHGGGWDTFILKFNSYGIRQWATYYGGNNSEFGISIATDEYINILITGRTKSLDFPVYNPGGGAYFQGTYGGGYYDAFILKFNSVGKRQWATYYGSNSTDMGHSITIDKNNNILVTGHTESANFPVQDPGGGAYFQGTHGGGYYNYDAFILKFNSVGVRQWATYYGGNCDDVGRSIATDKYNNVLITGHSNGGLILCNPGGGAYFQSTASGFDDAFIIKFDYCGVLFWATYYGGNQMSKGDYITSDRNNNILITGRTKSPDFPLYNPGGGAYFQETLGGYYDAFILKFNSTGIRQWATYYGGGGNEGNNDLSWYNSITTDSNNSILITGTTRSMDFPVYNPGGGAYFQGIHGGGYYDAFILKFNSTGVRQWATYYGGNSNDVGRSIITDNNCHILVTGETNSTNFPVYNPGGGAYFQGTLSGYEDGFILNFNSSGVIVDMKLLSTSIPDDYVLYQNYPNPFNPTTNIKFDLPKSLHTKLIVYDILGKEITTLINEKLSAGSYEVNWDGSGYPSGVYFYKLIMDEFVDVKKMVLVK